MVSPNEALHRYSRRQLFAKTFQELKGPAFVAAGAGLIYAVASSNNKGDPSPCIQEDFLNKMYARAEVIADSVRGSRPFSPSQKEILNKFALQAINLQTPYPDHRFSEQVSEALKGTLWVRYGIYSPDARTETEQNRRNLSKLQKYSTIIFDKTGISQKELAIFSLEKVEYLLYLVTGEAIQTFDEEKDCS